MLIGRREGGREAQLRDNERSIRGEQGLAGTPQRGRVQRRYSRGERTQDRGATVDVLPQDDGKGDGAIADEPLDEMARGRGRSNGVEEDS